MSNSFNRMFGAAFASIGLLIILAAGNTFGQVAGTGSSKSETKPQSGSPAEINTRAFEKIIRDYLLRNPEVVREALIALQVKEEKERGERSARVLVDLKNEVFSDPESPVSGNPNGDVTIVVFLDYNCGYCKTVLPELQALAKNDSMIRIVYKEMPILGPQSRTLALAALAAGRQGKYLDFHNALLATEAISGDSIREISTRLGLDFAILEKDMGDPRLGKQIENNLRLSTALYLDGTPAYIIGKEIIRGAIDSDTLADIVASTRAEAAKRDSPETKANSLK